MLSRSTTIKLPYGSPLSTPILLPSFSSKGFPELRKIVKQLEEHIWGPVLFSAYDISHGEVQKRIPFAPTLLFIDSGGYECSSMTDFVEHGKHSYRPKKWNKKLYFEAIKSVFRNNERTPKVIASYDHPKIRISINKQIKSADLIFKRLYKIDSNFMKEIIIKPETKDKNKQYININSIARNVKKLEVFDIIGVTEKELGKTLLEIMVNIGKISKALKESGNNQLIHILGSLDPISTPLYFMCGADIFDGLTWMRYSFHEGQTIYQQNYWFKEDYLDSRYFSMRIVSFIKNLSYLKNLQFEMRNFLKTGDFTKFRYNGGLFKNIWDRVETQIEEGG